MEAFVRPGVGLENWVSRSNYPALNIIQTGPQEMSLYVNQNYAQPTAALHRYSMRLDGLASLRAGRAGGTVLTRPVTFEGDALEINFSTSAAGGVKVELQRKDGEPIEGYSLADCVEQIGNELDRRVTWRREGGATSDVSQLAGEAVCLRFHLVDADLFAIRFTE
jgi:hypothetical protein